MDNTYYVKGMHCPSCELVIEKRLLEFPGVESAEADRAKGTLAVRYGGAKPSLEELNRLFKESGYVFSEKVIEKKGDWHEFIPSVLAALGVIIIFLFLEKLGLASHLSVSADSSFWAFLILGMIAGVSSCAALVGGLILSLSKKWSELGYDSGAGKYEPHILFNIGRIISYGIFGYVLGYFGSSLQFSPGLSSALVVLVSIIMVLLALQMMGARFFNLSLPKRFTGKIAKGSSSGRKIEPLVIGLLTIFLPCGFTLLVEGVAVLAGGAARGMLIMASFAIGTAIPLFFIGASSAKLIDSKWSDRFLKMAGILIIFFVIFNLNAQFNFFRNSDNAQSANMAGQNVQNISAEYDAGRDISPTMFEVKVGQPVRFTVTANADGSGCMSTIMVPGLYDTPQLIKKGQTIIMDFTPPKTGEYKITCAMGVPRGVIKVID
jgi:sulfite exporter TauE/SafE/copper chaperone CopZ